MTPAEILDSRAQLLLGECERENKQPSVHTLDVLAGRFLPEVSLEDRRAAVHAAMRLANRREVAGDTAPARAAEEQPRKRRGGRPPVPPGAMTPRQLRALTAEKLRRDPEVKPMALWDEIKKIGLPACNFSTWQVEYFYRERRNIEDGEAPAIARKPAPAARVARPAPPPTAVVQEVGQRPGVIEIGGGGDLFRALRRPDGGWDVELRAGVDHELMNQLAAVMWERVVGTARVA